LQTSHRIHNPEKQCPAKTGRAPPALRYPEPQSGHRSHRSEPSGRLRTVPTADFRDVLAHPNAKIRDDDAKPGQTPAVHEHVDQAIRAWAVAAGDLKP